MRLPLRRRARPVAYVLAIAADGSAFALGRDYKPLGYVDAEQVRRWATAPTQDEPWQLHADLAVPADFRPVRCVWLFRDGMKQAERRRRFAWPPSGGRS